MDIISKTHLHGMTLIRMLNQVHDIHFTARSDLNVINPRIYLDSASSYAALGTVCL